MRRRCTPSLRGLFPRLLWGAFRGDGTHPDLADAVPVHPVWQEEFYPMEWTSNGPRSNLEGGLVPGGGRSVEIGKQRKCHSSAIGEAGEVPRYHGEDSLYALAGNCGTYPGRFTETQLLCIVRASSLKSLGTLLKPLQTTIVFYARIRINQPINDL